MPRTSLAMAYRKLPALAVSVAMAVQPLGADAAYYYRNVNPKAGVATAPGTNPQPTPDQVKGTGSLAVYAASAARARPGVAFGFVPVVQDAASAVRWESVGAALPPGLSVAPATGTITGSPTDAAVGTYAGILLRATDASGNTGTTQPIALTVAPRPVVSVPAATTVAAGAAVAIAPTVQGALGSQTWTLRGALPVGLALDAATGRIAGSTTQAGTASGLVLTVTDSDGARGSSEPFGVTVTSSIVIGGLSANYGARLNKPIPRIQPSLSGGHGQTTWSIASGSLPAGLTVDLSTGAITGSPSQGGSFPGVTLQATDAASGASVTSAPFTVTVASAPTVTLSPLAYFARSGSPISVKPSAVGLVGSARWILNGGNLPAGLALNPATGEISGSPTATARVPTLSLTLFDLYDGAQAATPAFSLSTLGALAVGKTGAATAEVGEGFSLAPPSVTNLGGTPTWSVVGALPAGLSVDAATGVVSGTPTAATPSPVQIQYAVADALDGATAQGNPFTLSVLAPGTLSITGLDPAYTAFTGQAFRLVSSVVGARPPVIWSASALPGWASFDSGTGAITGTPGAAEAPVSVQLTAQDAANKSTTSTAFTLSTVKALSVAYGPGSAVQGQAFALSPSVASAQGGTSFALQSGTLPEGLALDPATGRISGTSFAAGNYPLVVSAKDSQVSVASNAFVIAVAASVQSASIPASPAGQPNQPFSVTATASGFAGPVSWAVASGTLPAWASLGAATGTVGGTPTATGYFGPLVLEASDASGGRARTDAFNIVVSQTPVLTAKAAGATTSVGSSFALVPQVTNSQGAVGWALTAGALPAGLSLSAATGAITGTPTTAGTSPGLVLTATDATGATAATAPFSITVAAATPLAVSLPASSFPATLGQRFATAAPAVSYALHGYTVALASGTLPAWATLDAATGVISGTPTGVAAIGATSDLQLVATDGDGRTAKTGTFSIQVARTPLAASGATGLSLHPGVPYSGPAPQAANALGAVSWSTSPPLPAGLSIDAATGAISGTIPSGTPSGSTGYALVATDLADDTTARAGSFQVTVLGTPAIALPGQLTVRYGSPASLVPGVTEAAAPARWSLSAGTLPPGLTLDAATGAITGTPTALGTTSGLQLAVVDAQNATGVSATFAIQVVNTMVMSYPSVGGGRAPAQRVTVPWTSPAPIATGAIGAVTYALASGSLPQGMRLDPATGVVSGTPTAAFSGSITLTATDSQSQVATTPALDVSMGAAPTVALADVVVRAGASIALVPSFGNARPNPDTGTVQLTLSGGTLPQGLNLGFLGLGRTWTLYGTPKAPGSVAGLVLRVTDYDGAVGSSAPFSVTVEPGIAISGLQPSYAGRAGVALPVPVQPSVGNAKGTVTWALSATPSGLSFEPGTGKLSGTPTGAFSGTVTLTATDASDGAVATATLELAIAPALQVLGAADVTTHVGVDASTKALSVAGQKGSSLAWTSVGTALPPFASLDAGTGIVTLRNPTLGTTAGVRLQAQDNADQATGASAAFALNVLPLPAVANVATSYTARLGFPFQTAAPTLSNAIGAATWSLASGALPSWARLNADGSVSGTPSAQGDLGATAGLVVAGTDATRTSANSPAFSINVYGQPAVTVASSSATGRLRVGDSYTLTPTATGVAGSPTWSVAYSDGSALPPGLSMDSPATGVVSGTVTGPGSATFTLSVLDSGDGATANSPAVSLTASPALGLAAIPDYKVHANQAGSGFISTPTVASGVVGNASFTLAPASVPPGMNPFDAATGVLSGLPSAGYGPVKYTITVTDGADGRTASTDFTVTVVDTLAFGTQPADVAVTTGQPVAMAPALRNVLGSAGYALQRDGAAAPNALASCTGLAFSTATGAVTGTPTAPCTVTGLTILASDSTQSATSATFGVAIAAANVALSAPSLTVQEGSTGTLQASSNLSAPTWSLAGAPAGSTVSPDGLVSIYGGDVAADQASTVTVTATSGPYSSAKSFALTVQAAAATVATPQQVRGAHAFQTSVATTLSAPGTWSASAASSLGGIPDIMVAGSTLLGTAPDLGGSNAVPMTLTATYTADGAPQGAAAGKATGSATLTVQPRLTLAASAVTGTVGTPLAAAAPAVGNRFGTLSYALFNGAAEVTSSLAGLCPGLSFSATSGAISGTPTGTCQATGLTVKVHDEANGIVQLADDATAAATIAVTPATATVSSAAPTVFEGAAVALTATSSLPTPAYALTGTPPAWLSINAATGAISGNAADVAADTAYSFGVTATSGAYAASSATVTLTVKAAATTLSGPLVAKSGGSTTATVSTTLGGSVGYAFAAYKQDGTTPATDVTFSAVSNGTVTVSVAANAAAGTRYVKATATATNLPSTGAAASADSAQVALTVQPPLTIAMTDQSQVAGSKATLAPTVSNAVGSPTYALLQSGTANASALSACGYAFSTSTGQLTTTGATTCNVSGLAIKVTDGGGATATTSPTFSVIVAATNVPLAAVTVPNSPGTGTAGSAQSYPPMTAQQPSSGTTSYQAFYDDNPATYATIGTNRNAQRIAYFYNAAGIQTDCMVLKGAPGASGAVTATFYLGTGAVGSISGTVQAGKYTTAVASTPIAQTDSLEILAASGTINLAEFRLGNMSGGVCVQPGTGGPRAANYSFAGSPQPLSVTAGGAAVTTTATLSGTASGVTWTIADASGAAAPAWLTTTGCDDAQCTVTAAPGTGTATGTYPLSSSPYYLTATDSGGATARSSGFTVAVLVPPAATTLPNSKNNGAGVAQSYPAFTATASVVGGSGAAAFYDNSTASYAALTPSARIAYFYDVAGVQADCAVVKGAASSGTGSITSNIYLVNTKVATVTGPVTSGALTQIVFGSAIPRLDSLEVVSTSGSLNLAEFRLGNMSGGVCVQPGTGGPTQSVTFATQPQAIAVAAGGSATTAATLSGTPSGTLSWSLVDATGAAAPSWATTQSCTTGANASCTVKAAPTSSVSGGTYALTLVATDSGSGVQTRSSAFNVTVSVTASAGRPTAMYLTSATGSCADGASGCTSLPVQTAWAGGGSSITLSTAGTNVRMIEFAYPNAVTVGSMAFQYSDTCPSAQCTSTLQWWNGSGWTDYPPNNSYWAGSTGSGTASSGYGNGTASSARWRYVFGQANGGSITLGYIKLGDTSGKFAP